MHVCSVVQPIKASNERDHNDLALTIPQTWLGGKEREREREREREADLAGRPTAEAVLSGRGRRQEMCSLRPSTSSDREPLELWHTTTHLITTTHTLCGKVLSTV